MNEEVRGCGVSAAALPTLTAAVARIKTIRALAGRAAREYWLARSVPVALALRAQDPHGSRQPRTDSRSNVTSNYTVCVSDGTGVLSFWRLSKYLCVMLLLVVAAVLAASGPTAECSVFVADLGMTRMVELNADAPFCALHHDRSTIQRMVLNSDPKKVRQISGNLVADLEETCKALRSKGKNQSASGGIMYPGTKWCGPGNVASSYDDLGAHRSEDICCREHDHCPRTIVPQQCIHGICNYSPFTRSHCDCDARFRRCLQTINTEVANTLGALFFNVIQVTCFKERRPCSQWQRNGYTEAEWAKVCSQFKFQPSDKYVPLMPLHI